MSAGEVDSKGRGMQREWDFDSVLYRWEASQALYVFAAVTEQVSDDIDAVVPLKGGFGSVRVRVRLGGSSWTTSVFPDTANGCYFLPIKAAVRRAEAVGIGDPVRIHLEVLE